MSSNDASPAGGDPTPAHGEPAATRGHRTPTHGEPAAVRNRSDQPVSIVLNGERRPVAAGLSVGALLRGLALRAGMVVVERNREILPRDALDAVPVEDGDQIEIVHFVGGG